MPFRAFFLAVAVILPLVPLAAQDREGATPAEFRGDRHIATLRSLDAYIADIRDFNILFAEMMLHFLAYGGAALPTKFGGNHRSADVLRDYAEPAREFRQSAEQGNEWAQFIVGTMYEAGLVVSHNPPEAARWFRMAAERGDENASAALGGMYYRGEGAPRDRAEAIRWFRRSANLGNARAQMVLGLAHYAGHGMPRNATIALAWIIVAFASGEDRALKWRDELRSSLAPAQVREAEELCERMWEEIEARKSAPERWGKPTPPRRHSD